MIVNALRPEQALVVRLSGELDLSARKALDRALAPLVDAPIAIIDLSRVSFADATLLSAVAKILSQREARFGRDAPLRIAGARPIIVRMFRITGVDTLVQFYDSVHDAAVEERTALFQYMATEGHVAAVPHLVVQ
jgi:anti-anti-sigma factor